MSTFTGFSEDDIKKAQNGVSTKQDKHSSMGNMKVKKASLRVQPKHAKKVEIKSLTVLEVPVSETGLFTQTIAKETPEAPKELVKDETKDCKLEQATQQIVESSNEEVKYVKQKFKDLEEFQAKQKMIEEQNKRRKELLTKALEDRTKRTQEEAQRLTEIQNEFKKLDAILSNDVKILRHQIEIASLDYMEAQKRYHRIEKEFLEAKVYLHQKLERKEMLTEHLCTIIEENEERKAKKLTELLNKLQMSDSAIENSENGQEHPENTEVTSPEAKVS